MAVTIINGQAVCYDHLQLFAGGTFVEAITSEMQRLHLDPQRLPECTHV